jgi:Pyruvate/2-oxoacid:ferredoxin oxidoreductase delta subunit
MTSADKKDTKRKRATATIDPIGCTGCGVCVSVCPPRCITVVESNLNLTGVARVDSERCTGCSFCAVDCPWETITMVNPDGSLVDYSKTLAKLRGYA